MATMANLATWALLDHLAWLAKLELLAHLDNLANQVFLVNLAKRFTIAHVQNEPRKLYKRHSRSMTNVYLGINRILQMMLYFHFQT